MESLASNDDVLGDKRDSPPVEPTGPSDASSSSSNSQGPPIVAPAAALAPTPSVWVRMNIWLFLFLTTLVLMLVVGIVLAVADPPLHLLHRDGADVKSRSPQIARVSLVIGSAYFVATAGLIMFYREPTVGNS
jgi:hypothetical protein